jgi:hypothetical protein
MRWKNGVKKEDMKEIIPHWEAGEYLLVMAIAQKH